MNLWGKIKQKAAAVYAAGFTMAALAVNAGATAAGATAAGAAAQSTDLANSKLAKGLEQLLTDISTYLGPLVTVVGVICIIYFAIRRSAADEMDEKKWSNRIKIAIVSIIIGIAAGVLVGIISHYFAA